MAYSRIKAKNIVELQKRIIETGLTKQKFAMECGVSHAALIDNLNSKRNGFSSKLALAVSKRLGCDIWELFELEFKERNHDE